MKEEEARRSLVEEARRKARRDDRFEARSKPANHHEPGQNLDEIETTDLDTGHETLHGEKGVDRSVVGARTGKSHSRVTARCAMTSWHFFAMGMNRRARDALRCLPSDLVLGSTESKRAQLRLVEAADVKTEIDREIKDLERAYAKIDAFCKLRIESARMRQRSNKVLDNNVGTLAADTSRWSEATLEESLDLLRCAELVLEDTITNDMLADLSSYDASVNELSMRTPKIASDKQNANKETNLFLVSHYRDEVEWRELATKNALEVIISLHQHMLWMFPVPTDKTSKYLAQKQEQKRGEESLRYVLLIPRVLPRTECERKTIEGEARGKNTLLQALERASASAMPKLRARPDVRSCMYMRRAYARRIHMHARVNAHGTGESIWRISFRQDPSRRSRKLRWFAIRLAPRR